MKRRGVRDGIFYFLVLATAYAGVLMAGRAIIRTVSADAVTQPVKLSRKAPEFEGTAWLQAPGGAPVRLAARRGTVSVVHFWTLGCINCKRNLPIYERWHKRFSPQGVAVVGIHTPEFEGEKVQENVERAVRHHGITYPILLDPDYKNWERWSQRVWPAVYLVDKKGRLRYRWEGEMNIADVAGEEKMTVKIEELLREPD